MESRQSRMTRMLMKVYSMMDLMMVKLTLRMSKADMATQVYMAVDIVSSFTLLKTGYSYDYFIRDNT